MAKRQAGQGGTPSKKQTWIQFTESDYEKLRQSAFAVSALAEEVNRLPADDENNLAHFATMTDSYLWKFYEEIAERIDKAREQA